MSPSTHSTVVESSKIPSSSPKMWAVWWLIWNLQACGMQHVLTSAHPMMRQDKTLSTTSMPGFL